MKTFGVVQVFSFPFGSFSVSASSGLFGENMFCLSSFVFF